MRPIYLLIVPILFLTGCASVSSFYTSEGYVTTQPKYDLDAVEFVRQRPSRAAIRIGLVSVNGNGFSDFDNLIQKARTEAASYGGDFILIEKSGVETDTTYTPGHSTYQSNGYASYGTHTGYGQNKANGYSVGPSVSTHYFPWAVFSVWVYKPSRLGLIFDEDKTHSPIVGFHLNSNAEKAGVRIGDKVIGIDDYDIHDQRLLNYSMTIQPGDKVKLTLQRGSKRIVSEITTIPND